MDQQSRQDDIPEATSLRKDIEELVEKKVAERFEQLQAGIDRALSQAQDAASPALSNRATLMVFSGDLDRLMSAFMIATGAVAMGLDVSMYFAFWSLVALKKTTSYVQKTVPQKMLSVMLPSGPERVGTSRMNMLGMGPMLFKRMMSQQNVETLPDLIALAREMGVRLLVCQMSMGVMGIRKDELIDGLEYGGVGTYLGDATDSKLTLFI
jgi:peroxiredoxin family protein